MSSQSITLHLPGNAFQRLQRMAQTLHQPLETIVYQSIQGNLPPLIEDAPEEWRDDLAEMEQLDDEALWIVAKASLSEKQWERHQELLERNQSGALTDSEREELERLRIMTDRFVFRRSYALALLKWRGHLIATELSAVS
jgi:hypothetical protein